MGRSSYRQIGVWGLGLMGGCLAHCIRHLFPDQDIVGISGNQEALEKALADGVITSAAGYEDPLPETLDLLFVCTPISRTVSDIQRVASSVSHPLVITDIASVKHSICEGVGALPDHVTFIGGHPMAGIEKTGYAHASLEVVHQATYLVMEGQGEIHDRFCQFLRDLQFNVLVMGPEKHDKLVALASHFPYLMAVLTMQVTQTLVSEADQDAFSQIVSSGFRDTTRVAGSSPLWGQDVCQFNRQALLDCLQTLQGNIPDLLESVDGQDMSFLSTLFDAIQGYRRELS